MSASNWAKQKALEWVLDHEQTPYREDIDSLAALLDEARAEALREVVAWLMRAEPPRIDGASERGNVIRVYADERALLGAMIQRGDHLKGEP